MNRTVRGEGLLGRFVWGAFAFHLLAMWIWPRVMTPYPAAPPREIEVVFESEAAVPRPHHAQAAPAQRAPQRTRARTPQPRPARRRTAVRPRSVPRPSAVRTAIARRTIQQRPIRPAPGPRRLAATRREAPNPARPAGPGPARLPARLQDEAPVVSTSRSPQRQAAIRRPGAPAFAETGQAPDSVPDRRGADQPTLGRPFRATTTPGATRQVRRVAVRSVPADAALPPLSDPRLDTEQPAAPAPTAPLRASGRRPGSPTLPGGHVPASGPLRRETDEPGMRPQPSRQGDVRMPRRANTLSLSTDGARLPLVDSRLDAEQPATPSPGRPRSQISRRSVSALPAPVLPLPSDTPRAVTRDAPEFAGGSNRSAGPPLARTLRTPGNLRPELRGDVSAPMDLRDPGEMPHLNVEGLAPVSAQPRLTTGGRRGALPYPGPAGSAGDPGAGGMSGRADTPPGGALRMSATGVNSRPLPPGALFLSAPGSNPLAGAIPDAGMPELAVGTRTSVTIAGRTPRRPNLIAGGKSEETSPAMSIEAPPTPGPRLAAVLSGQRRLRSDTIRIPGADAPLGGFVSSPGSPGLIAGSNGPPSSVRRPGTVVRAVPGDTPLSDRIVLPAEAPAASRYRSGGNGSGPAAARPRRPDRMAGSAGANPLGTIGEPDGPDLGAGGGTPGRLAGRTARLPGILPDGLPSRTTSPGRGAELPGPVVPRQPEGVRSGNPRRSPRLAWEGQPGNPLGGVADPGSPELPAGGSRGAPAPRLARQNLDVRSPRADSRATPETPTPRAARPETPGMPRTGPRVSVTTSGEEEFRPLGSPRRAGTGLLRGIPFPDLVRLAPSAGDPTGGSIPFRTPPGGAQGSGNRPVAAGGPIGVVYLLDASSSMLFRGKLQRAQDAVKRALSELGPEDRFNVVTFSGSATRLSAQLLAPTRENLLRAFAFIDGMTLSPATNFSAGVRSVFSLASVTHVFLLSDGEPTEGTRDYAQLRAEIRQLNTAGARVLTLALGLGEQFPGIRLLQGIAEDSGGQFSYVNLR